MTTFGQTMQFTCTRGAMYGAGFGALYGTLIIPVIGTVYGLVIGGVLGAVLGIPMGLMIWRVTKRFFTPLTDIKRYQLVICILCGALAYVGAVAALLLFYRIEDLFSAYVQQPAFVAAAASVLAAYQFVRRYASPLPDDKSSVQQLQTDA